MKLRYSEADRGKTTDRVVTVLSGIFLGAAFFSVLLSAFGISWPESSPFSGGLVSGFINVWNGIADSLGKNNFIILEKYSVAGKGTGAFLTLLLILLTVISVLTVWSGIKALLLIYAAAFALPALFYGLVPGIWPSGLLTLSLMTALIAMDKGNKTSLFLFGDVILAAALSLAVIALLTTTVTLSEPLQLQKAGQAVTGAADRFRYGENLLANGQLNSLDGRKTGKGTALRVTMEKPRSMYLRGYIGEIYQGNRWERLSSQTCYGQRDRLYWLNKNGFSGLAQLSEASAKAGIRNGKNRVTITVANADRSNIYLPYETESTAIAGTVSRADSYLQPEGLTGKKTYDFNVSGDITGRWTDNVSRLYSHKKTAGVSRYFISESHYNVFVYQHYTGLSDRVKTLIQKEIGPAGGQKRHVDYKTAINNIRYYLKENYVYSGHFSSISENTDFAENFIRMHKGCDVHYATLATLMFRYYGIPARYVEGYLITPGDVRSMGAGASVRVTENRIHAWTEIYVDGFGWVPVEVTPRYYGVMKEADLSRGLTSINYENQFKTQKQKVTGRQKTRETSEKTNSRLLRIIAAAAVIILLALLILWMAYQLLRRITAALKRRRVFYGKDPRRAVCAVYGYMLGNEIPVSRDAHRLGDLAAYSREEVNDRMQQLMLEELKRGRHERSEIKKKTAGSGARCRAACLHRLRRKGRRKGPH